jgi:hypothetical protein
MDSVFSNLSVNIWLRANNKINKYVTWNVSH